MAIRIQKYQEQIGYETTNLPEVPHIQAVEGAFGGDVARGTQAIGKAVGDVAQVLQKHAVEQRQLQNDAFVASIDSEHTKAMQDALSDPTPETTIINGQKVTRPKGYLGRSGLNSIGSLGDFEKWHDTKAKSILDNIKDPATRLRVAKNIDSQYLSARGKVMEHEARETRSGYIKELESNRDLKISSTFNVSDVGKSLDEIAVLQNKINNAQGLDGATSQVELRKSVGSFVKNMVDTTLQSDPSGDSSRALLANLSGRLGDDDNVQMNKYIDGEVKKNATVLLDDLNSKFIDGTITLEDIQSANRPKEKGGIGSASAMKMLKDLTKAQEEKLDSFRSDSAIAENYIQSVEAILFGQDSYKAKQILVDAFADGTMDREEAQKINRIKGILDRQKLTRDNDIRTNIPIIKNWFAANDNDKRELANTLSNYLTALDSGKNPEDARDEVLKAQYNKTYPQVPLGKDDKLNDPTRERQFVTMSPAERFGRGFSQGVAGTVEGFGGALRWLKQEELGKAVTDYAQYMKKFYAIPDPKFIDQVSAGFGSMATFFIPGMGITKGVQAATLFPRLAVWLGVGASTVLEATVEAGSVYEQAINKTGMSPKDAENAASKTFWTNIPMLAITNKLGIFGENGGKIARSLMASGFEGLQEFSQSVISNIALKDPTFQGAFESAAVGAIVGGGTKISVEAGSALKELAQAKEAMVKFQEVETPTVDVEDANVKEDEIKALPYEKPFEKVLRERAEMPNTIEIPSGTADTSGVAIPMTGPKQEQQKLIGYETASQKMFRERANMSDKVEYFQEDNQPQENIILQGFDRSPDDSDIPIYQGFEEKLGLPYYPQEEIKSIVSENIKSLDKEIENVGRTIPEQRREEIRKSIEKEKGVSYDATGSTIADFGEKIGGARKDTSTPLGPRSSNAIKDDTPSWKKGIITLQDKDGMWRLFKDVGSGRVELISRQGFETQERASMMIPLAVVARNHRVYMDSREKNTYGIFRTLSNGNRPLVKGGFSTEEDANKYLVKNATQIIEHKFKFPEKPWLDRVVRKGGRERNGRNVSTKEFQDVFGFRAGEFGNWNMGSDGQAALNHAFDALYDLADTLGVDPKALSLNGRLAIAFGARGHGGEQAARAHYESDKVVINLTKIKGAGTLAHEWFHALDNHIANLDENKLGFATSGFKYNSKLSQDLRNAMKEVVNVMTAKVEDKPIDQEFAKKNSDRARDYLNELVDRLDKNFHYDMSRYKKNFKKPTPTQESKWTEFKNKLMALDVGEKIYVPAKNPRHRLAGYESFPLIEEMNTLYKQIQGNSFSRSDQDSLGRSLFYAINRYRDYLVRVSKASEGKTETRTSATSYFREAKRMDDYRASRYWSTVEEMAARAFESYVFDKIEQKGLQSDYLVHSVDNKLYKALLDMAPYPEGTEREAINKAFDNLIETIDDSILKKAPKQEAAQKAKGSLSNERGSVVLPFPEVTIPEIATPKSLAKAGKDFNQFADAAMVPLSTRLGRINESLRDALRKFEFNNGLSMHEDLQKALPFMEHMADMPETESAALDLALKNADRQTIEEIVNRNGIRQEYEDVRELLDGLYNRAKEVGLDVKYLDDYFPRRVENPEEFLNYLRNNENWSAIDKAIKQEETKIGSRLNNEERVEFINKLLRGYGNSQIRISKPSNIKSRKIQIIDEQMNAFYKNSTTTLQEYIVAMNKAIEAKKFFGMNGKDIENSIGSYVKDLVDSGMINHTQEREVADILKARFSERGTHGIWSFYKNLGYLYTMSSPISAITQIGDLSFALYENGFYSTAKGLGKAFSKNKITKQDLGIDVISDEFSDQSKSGEAVTKVFKLIGLEAFDNIGKETLINGAMDKLSRQARENNPKLTAELERVFGDEAQQTLQDLINQEPSVNVKYLLFSRLAKYQPIALSEMPEYYSKGGNLRIFYMLKSYTVKQIDAFNNEVFSQMQSNPKQAIKNLVRLSLALMTLNAGADVIKDVLLGRPTKASDLLVDNILRLFGFSKYTIYKAKREGLGEATMKTILPPIPFVDDLYKDIAKGENLSDYKLWNSIPFVGKFYYWWFGGGREYLDKKKRKRSKTRSDF